MGTEHQKLIYQLSRVYNRGDYKTSIGFIYPKEPLTDSGPIHNIWAKRAAKKGYLKVVEENPSQIVYQLTEDGLALLKKHKQYYLQIPNNYDMFKPNNKPTKQKDLEELKKERRKERRRLRKLKQLGSNK